MGTEHSRRTRPAATATDETIDERENLRAGGGSTRPGAVHGPDPGPSRRTVLRSTGAAVGAATSIGLLSSRTAARTTDERDVLFTGNRRDGTLTLTDASTYDELGTIDAVPDGEEPALSEDPTQRVAKPFVDYFGDGENYVQDLDVSPDGRTVYVSRGHRGDVAAIDVETNDLRWRTEIDGFRADHQTISDDGRFLYTSAVTADAVHKIDTERGERVATVDVTTYPHGNHLHEIPGMGPTLVNGSLGNIQASDRFDGDHRLTFVDPADMTVRRKTDFEEGVRPIAFSPDDRTIYVQISYLHGFHEYDAVNDRITRTKHLPKTEHVPEDEDEYPLESAHHGIDVSADGEYLCVAGTTSWYAAVVRRSDLALVDTVHVGEHPYWVKTAPDGEHAFVAVKGEDAVSVVNYEDAAEVARIPVGADPMVMDHRTIPEPIL